MTRRREAGRNFSAGPSKHYVHHCLLLFFTGVRSEDSLLLRSLETPTISQLTMSGEEAWVDFVSGWISGGVSVLAIQPIDTVLTRLQANAIIPANNVGVVASSSAPSSVAASPVNILRGMVSNFGIASLWRGSSPMIGAVPVQNALLMMGYGAGKRWSEGSSPSIGTSSSDNNESNKLLGVFIGGCTGGILQSFIMSPVEYVKVMQQVGGTNATSATANVVSSGILSLAGTWKGLGATLLRDGIPHGVWFASYEYAKIELGNYRIEKNGGLKLENDIATPMRSGAFAATTAWAVGYPFDLIKTRIQAGSGTGIFATATMLIDEAGGMHGLYKGFTLKLLRSIPASAIGFLTYETAAKYLSAK